MNRIDIAQLSPDERLSLIGRLWDSLEPEAVPVRSAVRDELERRLQSPGSDPAHCIPWESVMAELGRQLP